MAVHPVNDRFKVLVDKPEIDFGGDDRKGFETGVVVEVPDMTIYLSFHSFGFEDSLAEPKKLTPIVEFYRAFLNKRVYWEAYQDRGRRIKDGDDEYIFLQMTDVLAYSDEVDEKAEVVTDSREGGFKV